MVTSLLDTIAACRIEATGPVDLDAQATDIALPDLDKASGKAALKAEVARIAAHQTRLAAEGRQALLCVLQSMDAGGKDSTIRHVFTGIDAGGVHVASFKAPSREEMGQDFLRRMAPNLPKRGEIAVFNRSYYEEVLITRLHPEMLAAEHLPKEEVTDRLWQDRLEDIAAHERYLARQGISILKFFLHISKEEQRLRFLRRLDRPDKIWKFEAADVAERARWDDYTVAYGEAIGATAAPKAPWFVIPADRKWVARLLIATAVRQEMERLNPHFPKPDAEAKQAADKARVALEGEA